MGYGWYYPPPQPQQARVFAPIPAQGQQPPPFTFAQLYATRSIWPEPTWPTQYAPKTVVLTFTYPPAPPPVNPASAYSELRQNWPEASWPAQRAVVSWVPQLPPVLVYVPVSNASFYALRSLFPEPSWPTQYAPKIAALQISSGNIPPVPLSTAVFNAIRSTWPEPSWAAQHAPNFIPQPPLQVFVPYTPQVVAIWDAWIVPQIPMQLAPFSPIMVQGDQPQPMSLAQFYANRSEWPELTWNTQRSIITGAPWNFYRPDNPPTAQPFPWQIWAANQPPWYGPQSAAPNAGWNVTIPQNPPFQRQVQWQIWSMSATPWYPAQSAKLNAATIPPPPATTSDLVFPGFGYKVGLWYFR